MTEDHEIPEVGNEPRDTPRGARDAALVARVRAGDSDAFGELYDRWFDRVLDLAYRILWNEQAAADVAQDTFMSAWNNLYRLEDPNAFGGWLLRIARNAALDRKRKDERARPVEDERLAMIERSQLRPEETIGALDDPARVAEDASYVAMLWDAADALGERDREVLDLQLRHGLAPAEIAEVVGLNRNAANQLVHRVRQRLTTAIGARMLWRGGEPLCATLRAELVANDVERFDADAVRVTDRHAAACAVCTERKKLRLSPAQLFSGIPILSLPALKAKVAYALDATGVPMQGSETLGGDGSGSRQHRVRRGVIGAAIAAAIIVLVIAFGAVALSHEPRDTVAVAGPSSTTSSSTSTSTSTSSTSTSTSTTRPSTTTTVAPIVVPPVTVPRLVPTTVAPTTTTTTIPVTVTFTLSTNQAPMTYPKRDAPVLTWAVTGVRRVHVYDGAGDLNSGAAHGSSALCPGAWSNDTCTITKAGEYVYNLDAYNAAGTLILHRNVTLVVG